VFTHILIPTDLTDRTEPTLALAVKMPRTSSSHFTLLHVVQNHLPGSFDEFESFYHRMEQRARAQMADLVRRRVPTRPASSPKSSSASPPKRSSGSPRRTGRI
jgi:nucleotide-binding universal stress UspA family protein